MTTLKRSPMQPAQNTTDAPVLSVVIPVHNDRHNLERCLRAIDQSVYRQYEVVVIDDGSTDETPEVAERLGARVICLQENLGPAAARNFGAERAHGRYLLFVDADVCVNEHTIGHIVDRFEHNDDLDAVFGSYDHDPEHRGLFSQYRNLVHHFVHQTSNADATTFWSGCGAVRKSVFLTHGGFDVNYARPCIEDIELGVRLSKAGHRIMLDGGIQATHLKQWTFWKMIKTDIFDRGVPWTRLMLEHGSMPNDLNLRISQRVSALLALIYVVVQAVAAFYQPYTLLFPLLGLLGVIAADSWRVRKYTHRPGKRLVESIFAAGMVFLAWLCGWWSLAILTPLVMIVLLNLRFYWFFVRQRSLVFTIFVAPLHLMYYLYSVLAYGIGVMTFVRDRLMGRPRPPAAEAV